MGIAHPSFLIQTTIVIIPIFRDLGNTIAQIQRTNRRQKAKGTYLTEDELRETLQEAYDLALETAALETFEGQYQTEELGKLVNQEEIIQQAMNLII